MLRQFCFAKITVVSPLLLALSDLFLVNCCVGMCLDALLGENLEEIRGRLKSKAASGGFVLSYTKSTLFSGAGECPFREDGVSGCREVVGVLPTFLNGTCVFLLVCTSSSRRDVYPDVFVSVLRWKPGNVELSVSFTRKSSSMTLATQIRHYYFSRR
ncbi:uncharacterized protein LOC143210246 isoform X1 [Lasioglossum baleicum]|uniref:uncharacterized protein LOC143210246 isoform X1 n=1 Tax=Lasioglossum baleicum TaxID=434251 RepID=UPI003FCE830A